MKPEQLKRFEDMTLGQAKSANEQIHDWARAWVQNETMICDPKSDRLSQAERDALLMMQISGAMPS